MRAFLLPAFALSALVITGLVAASGCGSDTEDNPNGGSSGDGGSCTGFGCSGDGAPACTGFECNRVTCDGGATTTTLSGTVLDPAGKVPIFNAAVYIPNGPVAPLTTGPSCDHCDALVTGKPVAIAFTDTSGKFTLTNVPVANNVPLVIQIGKWRRQVQVPAITACVDTAVDVGSTRLPRNRGEGDIPRIAVATGAADPLQCLLKKVGLDETEFGAAGSDARIHLFAGGGYPVDTIQKTASSKFDNNTPFAAAESLWGTTDALSKYDVVLLACEGTENDNATHKPATAKQALYDYAKKGGRVFTSHYHHVFFSNSPDAAAKGVAKWTTGDVPPPAAPKDPVTTAVNADIVGTFPKALAMKDWLTKQNALVNGQLPMFDARQNVDAVNAGALNWISVKNPNRSNSDAVQYLTFNAPVGAADADVCGRVVFSNLHVGAGSEGALVDDPAKSFPSSCATKELSAQQKALEFMLFDLSSCIQKDDEALPGPH